MHTNVLGDYQLQLQMLHWRYLHKEMCSEWQQLCIQSNRQYKLQWPNLSTAVADWRLTSRPGSAAQHVVHAYTDRDEQFKSCSSLTCLELLKFVCACTHSATEGLLKKFKIALSQQCRYFHHLLMK